MNIKPGMVYYLSNPKFPLGCGLALGLDGGRFMWFNRNVPGSPARTGVVSDSGDIEYILEEVGDLTTVLAKLDTDYMEGYRNGT